MADVDRCICCGEAIPEGRQVCPDCEEKAAQIKAEIDSQRAIKGR